MPHAADSLHDLARKAMHTPELLDAKELTRLSEHVLKEKGQDTDIEAQVAKRVRDNLASPDPKDVVLLGRKTAGIK